MFATLFLMAISSAEGFKKKQIPLHQVFDDVSDLYISDFLFLFWFIAHVLGWLIAGLTGLRVLDGDGVMMVKDDCVFLQ